MPSPGPQPRHDATPTAGFYRAMGWALLLGGLLWAGLIWLVR